MVCSGCNKTKSRKEFLDSNLKSGIGRKCIACKGKLPKQKKRKKKAALLKVAAPRETSLNNGKSCRGCSTLLVEGLNWAPSRVKRRDYICGSCKASNKRASAATNTSTRSSASPGCPKCNSKMVMRYSDRYSREFWGCPKFPSCRGTRDA